MIFLFDLFLRPPILAKIPGIQQQCRYRQVHIHIDMIVHNIIILVRVVSLVYYGMVKMQVCPTWVSGRDCHPCYLVLNVVVALG